MPSHGWFDVAEIGPGVWMIHEPGHAEQVHSYLIEGSRDVAVLDTGMGVGDFPGLVASLTDKAPLVVHSHAHWDHVGASSHFDRVLVHLSEAQDLLAGYPNEALREWFADEHLRGIPLPDSFDIRSAEIAGARATGYLHHGDVIDLGDREIEILHTPGHSPGGITVLDRTSRVLFPADAVNLGALYLFGHQADLHAYGIALDRLVAVLDDVDQVYPSHYEVPMAPDDIRATREAYHEILAGRPPDSVEPNREVYDYGAFVFWIRPGAVEELRG